MTTSIVATVAQKYGLSEQEFCKKIIKNCINFNISKEDFEDFVYLADGYKLNPLRKEIYAVPKRGGGIDAVVGIKGWYKLIRSQDDYDGIDIIYQHDNNGKLHAAQCIIYLKSKKYPIKFTEFLEECRRDTEHWRKSSSRMLCYKAITQCARLAFGFDDIYDEDEVDCIDEAFISEVNHNPQNERVSDEVLAQIRELMEQTKTEEKKVLSFAKVASLTEMSHETGQIILEGLKERQRFQMEEEQQTLPSPKQPHTPTQQDLPGV
ncbi:recombinase RecT [Bartonella schoenbuchensis]|uniref:Bacteriophage recombination protein n=1 Tax=Bartonella schoenbuchensis (strain DSM 13525 / NCTC 13165 / R1) TaxID=687861 RepID=E6YZN5_BARSR|nr:recombinase RecT [Bartonella schoenbuchensis]AQX30791.1 phage recombination protein Bet [Bartonella schoenbuchensis R1]CBI82323.1 Bacteriophage recombination protein [Bartonella schoenbuchensis R1]